MRAPAPSLRPITGAPTFSARSIILWIFSANTSPSAPPNTVKSWLNTNTLRPSTVPHPVMTPSVYGRSSRPGGLGPVAGQQVELVEAAGVEEVVDPLAGEHLALLVLALDRTRRTGVVSLLAALSEIFELGVHRVAHCGPRYFDGRRGLIRAGRTESHRLAGSGQLVHHRDRDREVLRSRFESASTRQQRNLLRLRRTAAPGC